MSKDKECQSIIFIYGNMNDDKAMKESIVISNLKPVLPIREQYDCLCDIANNFAKLRGFDFGIYVYAYDCGKDSSPIIVTEFNGTDKQFVDYFISTQRDFYNIKYLKRGNKSGNKK